MSYLIIYIFRREMLLVMHVFVFVAGKQKYFDQRHS